MVDRNVEKKLSILLKKYCNFFKFNQILIKEKANFDENSAGFVRCKKMSFLKFYEKIN